MRSSREEIPRLFETRHQSKRSSVVKTYRILASGLVVLLAATAFAESKDKEKHPVYDHKMKSLAGKEVNLSKYKGKVLLIVNTASNCGATPQYGPLQKLHEEYADEGLAVLGFPCNQFGGQEPGTSKEISEFCESSYGVKFDMFSKIDVNGKEAAPLYQFLTGKKSGLKDTGKVEWNFEKFLVSRDGKVVARFRTRVSPEEEEVVESIKKELAKK